MTVRSQQLTSALVIRPLIVATLLVYLWWRRGSLSAPLLALGAGDEPLLDFRYFFYPMGQRLPVESAPVEGFLYSPFAALCFVPLGRLPYDISAWLWAATWMVVVLWLAHAASLLAEGNARLATLGWALVFTSFPIFHDLKFGQVSSLFVATTYASALLYERGQRHRAAVCLAFAISFKVYPLLFVTYFASRRDLRFLATLAGFVALMMVALPVAVSGAAATLAFYQNVVGQIQHRAQAAVSDFNSQSLQALAQRLLFRGVVAHRALWVGAFSVVRYGLCAGLLALTWRFSRRHPAHTVFLWIFVTTPFFVTTSWPHYFVYLPLVATALLAASLRTPASKPANIALKIAAVASAALSNLLFFDRLDDRIFYAHWGLLFVANLSALAGLAIVLAGNDEPHPAAIRALTSAKISNERSRAV